MMRHATILLLVLAFVACGGHEEKSASTAAPAAVPSVNANSLSPEQLGELGAQIQKTPDHANELLTHHGLTPETFEQAIRKVTESPDASKRYATAYRKASA